MKICFYVNEAKPQARESVTALRALARKFGLKVGEKNADVLVTLGGDGTILRAVREFTDVPVLGLNLGGLGYLASVGPGDFDRALKALAAGGFRVSGRTMLSVRRDGREIAVALNDVVVVREMTGHAAKIGLAVDGRDVTTYLADGLVIATPTGSTAYSLSAGGPVLMPDTKSFVVTPMNPHALGARPLVVGDGVTLAVTAHARATDPYRRCPRRRRSRTSDGETLGVYADGACVGRLADGDTVTLSRAARSARFVELDGYSPYAALAAKLGWRGNFGRTGA